MARRTKPTHLKAVEGRRDRRPIALKQNEPAPRENLVDAPDWLSDEQKAGWRYAIAHAPYGLLKTIDRAMLTNWVVSESIHKNATIKLQNSPMVLRTPQGAIMQSPFLGIVNRQAVIMKTLAADLGFSPAARTQIACESDPEEEDPADRFFSKRVW